MRNLYKVLAAAALFLFIGESYAQVSACGMSSRWTSSISNLQTVSTSGGVTNFSNATGGQYGQVYDYTGQYTVSATPGSSFNVTVRSSWYNGIYVDWNQDGQFNTTNERIALWYCGTGTCTRTYSVNVPGNAVGKFRMRIIASGTSQATSACGQVNYLDAEDYTIEIPLNNSARLDEILSPTNPLCAGATQIEYRIGNLGLKPLTSLEIGGIVKPLNWNTLPNVNTFPLSTNNWTGNIPPTSVDTNTYTYTYSLNGGFKVGDTLLMWSVNPNGVPDTNSSDDTVLVVMAPGVSGSYTVGLDTTDDFSDIATAVQFLDSVGAVCDTTYIYLDDSLPFNEQVTLNRLNNMSWEAPVIFTTNPNASGRATITHTNTGTNDNYVIRFGNNADYYIFDDLDLVVDPTSSTSYSTVVAYEDDAAYNRVRNCLIKGNPNSQTTSYYAALVNNQWNSFQGTNPHHNEIIGCELEGGGTSVNFDRGGDHSIFEDNIIRDPYYMAFDLYYNSGSKINGNDIMSSSTYTFGYGIYSYYSDEPMEIKDNVFHPGTDEWPRYGVYMFESTANAGTRNVIDNNSFSIGQTWSASNIWGMYLYRTGFTDITNNSFVVRSSSFDAYGLYLRDAGAIRVHNNNVISYGSGQALRYDGNSTVISSNNNNIYATGFILASYNGFGYTNMADWQNNAGYDSRSVNVDPAFAEVGSASTGLSDLSVCNAALDGAADVSYSNMYDKDGDMRDPNNPDIGVDEFVGLATVTLGADQKFCPGDTVSLEVPGGLTGVSVVWSTGDSSSTIMVNQPGSYSFSLRNNCGVAEDTVMVDHPDVVELSSNDTLICDGDMISVGASLMNASYNWNNGETSQSIMVDDEGEYIVDAVDQYGCPSSDTIEVMISESAQMNLSTRDTILCPGQFLSLESGVDPRTGVTYSWTGFNDGSTNTSNNVLLGWDEANLLVIEVNDNSCMSYDTLTIDNSPAPVAEFTATQRDGQTFTFTPDSTHPRFQYMWDFGDRTSSTQESPTKLYQFQGNYTVILEVTTLCGSVSEQDEVGTTAIGISEELANKLVKVYPNPSSGMVNVQLEASENVNLEVTDINGKVVFAKELGTVNATSTEQIDLSDLSKGVYMVRVALNDATVIKKLTVE